MSDRAEHLDASSDVQRRDLARLVCEQFLGSGIGRSVFVYRLDPKFVIKFESGEGFQNSIEFEIWRNVKDCRGLARWFAPCVEISGFGQWLIQARTFPIEKRQLPKRVPTIFTDLKIENWGFYEGRAVCHDYGSLMCRLIDNRSRKFRVADWCE